MNALQFSISRDEATPGYLPGALPAGTWRIILGLYRVDAKGVDVSLKIEIERDGKRSQTARLRSTLKLRNAKEKRSAQMVQMARVGGVEIFICIPSIVTATGQYRN